MHLNTRLWGISTFTTIIWITCSGFSYSFYLFKSQLIKWFLAQSLKNSRRWPSLNKRATSSLSCLQSSVLWPWIQWYLHIWLGFLWDGSVCRGMGYLVSLIHPMADTMPGASMLKLYSDSRGASVARRVYQSHFYSWAIGRSVLDHFFDNFERDYILGCCFCDLYCMVGTDLCSIRVCRCPFEFCWWAYLGKPNRKVFPIDHSRPWSSVGIDYVHRPRSQTDIQLNFTLVIVMLSNLVRSNLE